MIYKNTSPIETVVKTKKVFMTDEKNVFFLMIDSDNDEWSDIDSNDNLNKIVNDKRKRFEKANVAISLSSSTFIKLTCKLRLLSSFTTLK